MIACENIRHKLSYFHAAGASTITTITTTTTTTTTTAGGARKRSYFHRDPQTFSWSLPALDSALEETSETFADPDGNMIAFLFLPMRRDDDF